MNKQQAVSMNNSSDVDAVSRECEEQTLLQLARLGGYLGHQARSALVRKHSAWIHQRCRQTLANHADASDAAQEVTIKVFRALARFAGRSSLRTWMNVIIRNECMAVLRLRQKHVLQNHTQALLEIHLQQNPPSQAAQDSERELQAVVRQLLSRLSQKNREILQLRFFGELSLEDIGATLSLSLSATKMRLYRAMQQFRGECESSALSLSLFEMDC